jgi:hypothetical protein
MSEFNLSPKRQFFRQKYLKNHNIVPQARNNPTFEGPHPRYTPLDVVADEDAIFNCGNSTEGRNSSPDRKSFYRPENVIGDRKV